MRRLIMLSSSQTVKAPADVNLTRRSWEDAGDLEVFKAASQVSHNKGGIAWSLNLSRTKIQQLMKAATNGNDPTRPLTKEFNRQFQKHLGYVPPYSIGLEFNNHDRLHGHGSGIPREVTDVELKRFRAAVAAAGGKVSGTSGRGQVQTKPLHDGFGWAAYTTKSLKRTRQLLGVDRVTFVSRELKQLTRQAWEASLPPKRKWTRRTASRSRMKIPPVMLSSTSLSKGTLAMGMLLTSASASVSNMHRLVTQGGSLASTSASRCSRPVAQQRQPAGFPGGLRALARPRLISGAAAMRLN